MAGVCPPVARVLSWWRDLGVCLSVSGLDRGRVASMCQQDIKVDAVEA